MFRSTVALSTLVVLTLAGCGATPTATLGAASVAKTNALVSANTSRVVSNNAAGVQAPSVTVTAGTTVSRQHSTMTVLGTDEMSDAELADDAESLGYSLMSTATAKTGFVRRTASGWALETTTGVFTKTTTDYALTGTSGVIAQISARENDKTKVTGTLDDAGTSIDVSTVSAAMDLGVLTNWLTKGKFDGIVKDQLTRLPIAGAQVQAVAQTGGFVFTATTEPSGEFAIKCLEPGTYTLSITKDGYTASPASAEALKARKKVHLGFDLVKN